VKVLTPTELRSNKESQTQREIIRTKNVRDALAKEEAKLDATRAAADVALASLSLRHAEEEVKGQTRIDALNKEIKDLEDKKAVLLIPIHIDEERARIKLEDAEKALSEAKELQQRNEETAEILANKLDDVSEREQDCTTKEQKLAGREQNLKVQETSVSTLSRELSAKWAEYFAEKEAQDAKIAEEKSKIAVAYINIEARRKMQDARELSLNAFETKLNDERRSIDKYLKTDGKRKT
jgi:hypothetical protein